MRNEEERKQASGFTRNSNDDDDDGHDDDEDEESFFIILPHPFVVLLVSYQPGHRDLRKGGSSQVFAVAQGES